MRTATQILARVEPGRLQKAVEGFVSGAYAITVTEQSEAEIRGFVANGDGKEYGVVLSEGQTFCSCKDAMYRKGICKHAVVLALHVMRTPKAEAKPAETEEEVEEQPVNMKLSKVRKGFAFSA
jgi:predicted nucleic acid-binding Zn finger protein